ncbi:GGDEF domain-containing protein [Bacillus sp. JJ1764]|uniref:GGDEF domain-containing protein n=1 Tax=Bacillus sp. JJ1764 TaxID=3122964 RepID=UPI002FFF8458
MSFAAKDFKTSTGFLRYYNDVLFERLRLVSLMLIFTYPCFFVVDFILLRKPLVPIYKEILISVHIFGPVISVIFLMIYRRHQQASKESVVKWYTLIYLLVGAVSSINSQLLTGNLYAYIIILFGVAVIFPIRPKMLIFFLIIVQSFFISGLYLLEKNQIEFILKLVNSTGAVVISYVVAYSFYTYQKKDYINKQKLSQNEESFRRLFHLNPNPLVLTTIDNGEVLLINKQAIEYYHLKDVEPVQFDTRCLFKTEEERLEILNRLEKENSIKNYVIEQQITVDLKKWALLHFESVDYLDQTCILIGTTDITDMKEKESELVLHASMDILTGVRNRRSGIDLLRGLLNSGQNIKEFILSFIDINDLKKVNDRYGHSIGDDLIKTSCDIIHSQIDQEDVLFRYGGDEFIVIFFQKQMEQVQQVWATIQCHFQNLNNTKEKPYTISASYGLYHYKPGTVISLDEILEIADREMYKNKAILKNKLTSVPVTNSK